MFTNTTPRPYKVTFRLVGGEEISESVMAFDLSEAMLTANLRLSSRGFKDMTLIDVGPDLDVAKVQEKLRQQEAAANFVTGLFTKPKTEK